MNDALSDRLLAAFKPDSFGIKVPGMELLEGMSDHQLRQCQIMGCLVRGEEPNNWSADFHFEPYSEEEIAEARKTLGEMQAKVMNFIANQS